MSIFKKIIEELTVIGKWFAKEAISVETVAAPIAVSIGEGLKTAEADGVLPMIAEVVDGATGTSAGTEANTIIQNAIPEVIAFGLGIQGLPADKTPAQIQAFCANVVTAIAGLSAFNKSKFFINFGSDVYVIVQTALGQTYPSTYAEVQDIIQKAYVAYQTEKANATIATAVPPVSHAAEVAATS